MLAPVFRIPGTDIPWLDEYVFFLDDCSESGGEGVEDWCV